MEIVYFFLLRGAVKLQWAGGAQRPVGHGNEPKKTGERSARARTRGQNPLVYLIIIWVNFGCFFGHALKKNVKVHEAS